MGWTGGNEVFNGIARMTAESLQIGRDDRIRLLDRLIFLLQEQDWDTGDDSLREFREDEAVVEAFRRNGVTLTDETDDEEEPDEWDRRDEPPQLTATLGLADGTILPVGEIPPVTEPASAGAINVIIPYPHWAPEGAVINVSVRNEGLGITLFKEVHPAISLAPDNILTVSFTSNDIKPSDIFRLFESP